MDTGRNTVENLLMTYKCRFKMQHDGTTNPPDNVKEFTSNIVESLQTLDAEEEIEIVITKSNLTEITKSIRVTKFIRVKTGEVIAQLTDCDIEP